MYVFSDLIEACKGTNVLAYRLTRIYDELSGSVDWKGDTPQATLARVLMESFVWGRVQQLELCGWGETNAASYFSDVYGALCGNPDHYRDRNIEDKISYTFDDLIGAFSGCEIIRRRLKNIKEYAEAHQNNAVEVEWLPGNHSTLAQVLMETFCWQKTDFVPNCDWNRNNDDAPDDFFMEIYEKLEKSPQYYSLPKARVSTDDAAHPIHTFLSS